MEGGREGGREGRREGGKEGGREGRREGEKEGGREGREGGEEGGEAERGREGGVKQCILSFLPEQSPVQSPMHEVYTWPRVLVWTVCQTLRAWIEKKRQTALLSVTSSATTVTPRLHLNMVAELPERCNPLQILRVVPRRTLQIARRLEGSPGAIRRGPKVKPWQAQNCT